MDPQNENYEEKAEGEVTLDLSQDTDEIQIAQINFLKEVIKSAFDSRYGEIFRLPVDPIRDSVPDYFDVIKTPIDLGTILNKLDSNGYSDPNDCCADFSLMISNCYTYNPEGSVAHYQARELEKLYTKKMTKYPTITTFVPIKRRHSTSDSPKKIEEPKKDVQKTSKPPSKIKKTSAATEKKTTTANVAVVKELSRLPKRSAKEYSEIDKVSIQSPSMNFCSLAINELFHKKHNEESFPFLSPVDSVALNIPDYYDVIKCPMDLTTVRNKLKTNNYTHPQQFIRDVRLVFTNCYRYNSSTTDVFASALKLQGVFEHFISTCPKEIYMDLFVNEEFHEEPVINNSISRGTRRSQHVENRQILDYFQNIDRKLQLISEDVSKIKNDRPSKHIPVSENGVGSSKRPQSVRAFSSLTPLKNPTYNSLLHSKTEPEKIDDADPLTYDEKLALSSQIMCLPEPRIKEVLGIISQKEPWSRKLYHGKEKDVAIDLDSLQSSTLRVLEKYVQTLNRKKTESTYRKKCTPEERSTREQDLRRKLEDMESQLSGKTPIVIGSKHLSKLDSVDKNTDENIVRLSDDHSSSSDSSDDEFNKQYSFPKSLTTLTKQSSVFTPSTNPNQPVNTNLSSSTFKLSSSLGKQSTLPPRPLTVSSLKSSTNDSYNLSSLGHTTKLQKATGTNTSPPTDSASTSSVPNSIFSQLGITNTNSSIRNHEPPTSFRQNSTTRHLSEREIDLLREEERNKRMAHVGKIDINAQGELMKTFEEKF